MVLGQSGTGRNEATSRRSSPETATVDGLIASPGHAPALLAMEIPVVIAEFASRRRALDAALVEVAGEVLRRDEEGSAPDELVRSMGFSNLAEMLQQLLGVPYAEAGSLVRVAEATRAPMSLTGEHLGPAHSAVATALAAAQISLGQASAIVQGLKPVNGRAERAHLDAAETELVDSARGVNPEDLAPATPELLRVQAAQWVAFLDPDGTEPLAERVARKRGFWMRERSDGTVTGRFVATPEQGELLRKVCETVTSPRRKVAFEDVPPIGSAGADERGAEGVDAADVDVSHPDERIPDQRTPAQQRMDAVELVFARFAEAPDAPRASGEAPTVVITTTDAGLKGEAKRPADVPHLERTGTPVPPSLVAKTLCDGFVQVALLGSNGEPLRLGRRQRLYSRAQRRALASRDGGCITPGCWKPPGMCEAHHTTPWVEGGFTNVDEGVLLCSFHHHLAHKNQLDVVRDRTGRWRALRPGWEYRLFRRRTLRGSALQEQSHGS
ncbi:HNH endonuclease signature motif containing protein [Pseudoclavibacter sp. RFBG4]|uniref:HNH endonuclease signature motif containing protein n=1 Tax=Pseudoclavibacter sp. RFBG4 TaxID=2080575 RepID=UPI0011B032BC|nr:HNH endonuclease signature motif containing protein [Pseudoclavibacter sp. RFBG4]